LKLAGKISAISSQFQELTNILRSFFRDDLAVDPLKGWTEVCHSETPLRRPREIETARGWGVLTIGTGLGKPNSATGAATKISRRS
jgi:hypothetical protein